MSGNEGGHSAVVEAAFTRQAAFAAYLPSPGSERSRSSWGGSGHDELQVVATAEASGEQSRSPRAGVWRHPDVRYRRRQGFPWPLPRPLMVVLPLPACSSPLRRRTAPSMDERFAPPGCYPSPAARRCNENQWRARLGFTGVILMTVLWTELVYRFTGPS